MRAGFSIALFVLLLLGCSGQAREDAEIADFNAEDFSSFVALNAYDLDAERLAEHGIAEAYSRVLPELRLHVPNALSIDEVIDHQSGRYEVLAGSRRYQIVPSPQGATDYESWGFATFALFDIVNSQLTDTEVRFYAINAGHDLEGLFMHPEQRALSRKDEETDGDQPYIPTDQAPLFGQPVNGS